MIRGDPVMLYSFEQNFTVCGLLTQDYDPGRKLSELPLILVIYKL